ncbi:hypothetical protein ACIREE_12615 [Streptomyces sp. NPDC102467]|uniref:hypothetical protein n=1 Tax=Streptomyces sp. NPDC102467 TaxID=3366179 RepID=UPI00382B6D2D
MHTFKRWLDHSLIAQGALIFLLGLGFSALFRPSEHPALWAFKSALYTGIALTFLTVQRRRAGRAAGTDQRGVADLARKIRHGEEPRDPAERERMRRLVGDQLGRIERGRKWLPLWLGCMGLIAAGMLALGIATGSWIFPAVFAIGMAGFCSGIVWMRRRNVERLRHMDAALRPAPENEAAYARQPSQPGRTRPDS